MSAVFKRIDPKPGPVQLPELPIGMVAADHAAANDGGAAAVPPKTTESLLRRGLRGIFQMAATGGATLLVKGVATSVLMGSSSVPALAIMAGSVAVTSLTGSLITTYFHQCRERRETGVNTKSFGQVFARKLMMSAAISTATLGMVHNWASISSFCGPAFDAAARFAQPMLENSTMQNVLNALGNVAQRTTHALAQYSPLRFAHADDTGSLSYGPRSDYQPTYGSGPTETVSGAGELKMYAPAVDQGGETDLLKLYRHTPPSAPPAAAELPPIELESYKAIHAGDAMPAPHGDIAADAAPIAQVDVKSQVRALLESGDLDKKTAQAAKALLKNPENGQRLKDFAHFLLNKEHNPQAALKFYHLAAEAGNKQAIADLAYLESKGIGLPAQPAPPVTSIVDSGSPQPVFDRAGGVRAEWAHSGDPLQQATAPAAPTEAPSVSHGKLAAECRMRGVEATYNGPAVVENVDCTIHQKTMKPGDLATVTGPYGIREQFAWGGEQPVSTSQFFFGSNDITTNGFSQSKAGWGVGKIARSLASAFRGAADYARDFGRGLTLQSTPNFGTLTLN